MSGVRLDRLPNGLRVVSERMEGLESASVGLWVTAGGRHERAEENGVAHFLEHMAFKGTKRRSARDIAEAIEDVGGYLNAYTSREMTAYYARVLREDVALAVDVIADIVLNPAFDPGEIETERAVILQEIGQALDTPDDIVFDWLQEAAFPDQPLGRPILGPAERVQGFGRADLQGFVSRHYGPGRMILAAAGAVDHDRLMRQAEELFAHLPATAQPETPRGTFSGGERREIRPLEQVHLALALEGPTYLSDEIYTAQIHAGALGGGMSSRLFQEVRERRGLCYSVFAQAGAFADTGMLTLYAGTSAGQVGELGTVMIDEVRRAGEDLAQSELDRARAQMKSGLLMGLESASSRAERLARMVAIWNRVPALSETIAKIDAVDLAALRDYAGRLTTQSDMALALYGPGEALPELARIRERLAA